MLKDEQTLLTGREVADLFLVTGRTVRRWVDQGFLHPIKTPGGHYRFNKEEVIKAWRTSSERQT